MNHCKVKYSQLSCFFFYGRAKEAFNFNLTAVDLQQQVPYLLRCFHTS